jgi:nucleoside-diphosphate-sugar epimerase
MTRAFVAGATGYTGREVVRELCREGIETVAHVRPDSPRLEEWRQRFTASGARVAVTPWEPAAMAACLCDLRPDLVFALLGTTRARARRASREPGQRESYESVDYGLTRLLLDAVATAAPKARFVYLSSLGVREGTRNPYLAVRARLEAELRQSGLSYVIVRPGLITGPDREESRPAERVASVVLDGALALAGVLGGKHLQRRYASMTAATLARGLVRAATLPDRAQMFEAEALRALAEGPGSGALMLSS